MVQTFLLCGVASIPLFCFPAQQRPLALSNWAGGKEETGFLLFILAEQGGTEPVALGIDVTKSQKRSLSLSSTGGCGALRVRPNLSLLPFRQKAACFGVTSLGGGGTDV